MVEDGMRSQDAPLNGEAEEHGMGSPLIQDVATLKQSLKDAKARYEVSFPDFGTGESEQGSY